MTFSRMLSLSMGCVFLVFAFFTIFAISSLSASSTADAIGLTEYRANGLLFEYPADWDALAFGRSSAGNLSLQSPDSTIFLAWTRDPGVEPEKVLDQIERTYNGEGVKILSSKHSRMSIGGENASILEISYSMRKYSTRKRFLVWNGSRSDRLFFAALSGSSEGYNQSISSFDNMLETFSDVPNKGAAALKQRTAKGDSWAIVLGDLLSSYSYKDTSTLLSRRVYLGTTHSLAPRNGTYKLSSIDEIKVDPPQAAAARAAAAQDLLNKNGYQTRLVQRGGNIWIAVLDASANWQFVSLNPREPERMIGVLISEGKEGVVYRDISDLAEDNSMDLDNSIINSNLIIRKDCEPSRYAELRQPSSINRSWSESLQEVLDSREYGKNYKENVFDCSNTSQICWSILSGKGYDARILMSYKGHPLDPHMWVVVRYPYEKDRYVAVEATNTDKSKRLIHLGRITEKDDYYKGIMYNTSAQFSRLHPEEGMWLAGE